MERARISKNIGMNKCKHLVPVSINLVKWGKIGSENDQPGPYRASEKEQTIETCLKRR